MRSSPELQLVCQLDLYPDLFQTRKLYHGVGERSIRGQPYDFRLWLCISVALSRLSLLLEWAVVSAIRLEEILSLFEEAVLGSATPMLAFTQIHNSASVCSDSCVGHSFSVLAGTSLGSSLSVRQSLRVGSGVSLFRSDLVQPSTSVVDFGNFGSSLSVRSYSTMGSRVSTFGEARLRRSCPVLEDIVTIGSALSIKTWIRVRSGVSAFRCSAGHVWVPT